MRYVSRKHLHFLLKGVLPPLVGLGLLVLVIATLAGAFVTKIPPGQTEIAAAELPEEARTEQVHEVFKPYVEQAVGTFRAAVRTQVASQYPAAVKITRIHVRARSLVEKGALLVELDNSIAQAQLDKARSRLREVIENEKQARDTYNRLVAAREQNPISVTEGELTQARVELRGAEAASAGAQRAVDEATARLADTEIRAPVNGMVVDRLKEEGDTVQPGMPILVLYDVSSLRLEAPVMETLAVRLKVGQNLTVSVDALDKKLEGTVDEIVAEADPGSRSLLVKVSVPYEDGLYEEMSGRLEIPAGQRRHLCLAEAAVRTDQADAGLKDEGRKFVFVVRSDNTVEKRYIKTGQIGFPGRLEVLSGLEVGEWVVLDPCTPSAPCPLLGPLPVAPARPVRSTAEATPPQSEAAGERGPVRTAPKDAKTDVVQDRTIPRMIEAVGVLRAAFRTEIASQYGEPARIEKIFVRARDRVNNNDVLVELRSQAAQAQLEQAKANLLRAREKAEGERDTLNRYVAARALQQAAVSDAVLTQAQIAVDRAEAQVATAENGVQEASARLSDTQIRSPMSGIVVDRLREEGDTVRPGEPILVLYDPTVLRLEAPVVQDVAVKLNPRQTLAVTIEALGRKVEGTVDEIVPQAEAGSRSFLVKIKVPYFSGLYEGMFGRVAIPAEDEHHRCVDKAAIISVGQLEYVDVVGDDDALQRRLIQTGPFSMHGRVEVIHGLEAGERVLLVRPSEATPCPPSQPPSPKP